MTISACSHVSSFSLIANVFLFEPFLAHSKNELMQWRDVRRLSVRPSVCPSVNFCANRFFSQTNGRIATKLAHDGLQVSVHPGCAQGQVKVKGHVIRAFSWILGMCYSVIDGLVTDHISYDVIVSLCWHHSVGHPACSVDPASIEDHLTRLVLETRLR